MDFFVLEQFFYNNSWAKLSVLTKNLHSSLGDGYFGALECQLFRFSIDSMIA